MRGRILVGRRARSDRGSRLVARVKPSPDPDDERRLRRPDDDPRPPSAPAARPPRSPSGSPAAASATPERRRRRRRRPRHAGRTSTRSPGSRPGEKPPQFVVRLLRRRLQRRPVAALPPARARHRLAVHLLPVRAVPGPRRASASLYRPPRKPVGTSAIGFGDASLIPERIREPHAGLRRAATRSAPTSSATSATPRASAAGTRPQWTSELSQAVDVPRPLGRDQRHRPTRAQAARSTPASGRARAPRACSASASAMYPVFEEVRLHLRRVAARAPSSGPRRSRATDCGSSRCSASTSSATARPTCRWTTTCSSCRTTARSTAPPATCAKIETSTYQSLMQALAAVESGNRAPFFVGNHFNDVGVRRLQERADALRHRRARRRTPTCTS